LLKLAKFNSDIICFLKASLSEGLLQRGLRRFKISQVLPFLFAENNYIRSASYFYNNTFSYRLTFAPQSPLPGSTVFKINQDLKFEKQHYKVYNCHTNILNQPIFLLYLNRKYGKRSGQIAKPTKTPI
jgi:hypothetical protein